MRRMVAWTLIAVAASSVMPSMALAVLCTKKSGVVVLRTACKKKEVELSPAQFVGPQGSMGLPGATGSQGPAGPFPDPLESGKTLRGAWDLVIAPGQSFTQSGTSFGFTFATAPAGHLIPVGPNPDPTNCPGSATDPQAAPGHLCVYVTPGGATIGNPFICDPTVDLCGGDPSRTGFFLQASSNNTAVGGHLVGTWAATAP